MSHEYTNAEVLAHMKKIRALLEETRSVVPADTKQFLEAMIALGEFEVKNDAFIESVVGKPL